jgi:hypothetical protein
LLPWLRRFPRLNCLWGAECFENLPLQRFVPNHIYPKLDHCHQDFSTIGQEDGNEKQRIPESWWGKYATVSHWKVQAVQDHR